jgi:hypothetical protein
VVAAQRVRLVLAGGVGLVKTIEDRLLAVDLMRHGASG